MMKVCPILIEIVLQNLLKKHEGKIKFKMKTFKTNTLTSVVLRVLRGGKNHGTGFYYKREYLFTRFSFEERIQFSTN